MKQSKLMSFFESCGNTLSGFLISLLAQWLFLPAIGVTISFHQNLIFAVFMTFVSVGRGFIWRRLMEALHVRRPLSPFMQAVVAERYRQVEVEGWDAEHDDQHEPGELARAGATYAQWADVYARTPEAGPSIAAAPATWPWEPSWWKPVGFRRDLVKGCALIIAEGEKHDRNRKRATPPARPAWAEPALVGRPGAPIPVRRTKPWKQYRNPQ